MKFIYISLFSMSLILMSSCQKEDFAEAYPDPAKIATTSVERQFTGILVAGVDYVVPSYRNYFVTLRITLNPWTQSIGWHNAPNQYIPGSSGVEDVWFNYYDVLAQYRELEKIFAAEDATSQENRKIFKLAADVFVYGETMRMVDLFGTIPFFEAGLLSTNGGDYNNSYAPFDQGKEIYSYMLTELKSIANQLNSLNIGAGFLASFKAQDLINNGDIDLWRRYTNSLRLRMLTRVSGNPEFASQASTEIAEILNNPTNYPVVDDNSQNIMIDIYDVNSPINAKGFDQGINSNGWDGDDAPQKMIDFLKASSDPRLRVLFEPGTDANGEYIGLDPLLNSNEQTELTNSGQIAFYNRTTTSRNQFFPGVLINAAEVSFLKAEYYLNSGDDGAAKMAYEDGIRQSIEFYYYVNSISNDQVAGEVAPATEEEIAALLASDPVSWDKATSASDKLSLIAYQRWVHFNIIQPYQNWAEIRRVGAPILEFWVDNSSTQTVPPTKWNIPGNEITYNTDNYQAIQSEDKITNKVFWDMN
ncbi:MAG: SusD/RagB family nutrient-binding outer membrane lipoprotein [Saprospiraceae bacterium]|nr:SusD/RagB family nutrient-binding outer membrane lipoprotein [Saprospiraceae bacterium]